MRTAGAGATLCRMNETPATPRSDLRFDPALVRKYDGFGPRYTSYPTADRFHAGFTAAQYVDALAMRGASAQPLSLYVHLPFCKTICYYCACNKTITANRGRSATYVRYLVHEMDNVSLLPEGEPRVQQRHRGAVSPTFLPHEEMAALRKSLRVAFAFDADTGASIEVGPRKGEVGTIAFLDELGFNRISVGIQDFDPAVQKAVNRIQS